MEAQVKDMKAMKVAYAVIERNGKSFWNRIGVAFTNRDGSLNVKLDAIPVTGNLQIRDWEPREDSPDQAREGGRAAGGGSTNGKARNAATGPLTELPF